ncbi:hypothetical protein L6R50_13495 [Myxococcota bacterium]|nr:hypothetical protein [Myxococcota bacterium]
MTTVRTGPPVFAVFMVVSGAAGGACATLDESEAWRIRLCGMSVGYAIGGLVIGIITEAARSELKALDGARVGGEPGEAVPSAPRPDDLLLPRISVTAGPRAGGLELAWSF